MLDTEKDWTWKAKNGYFLHQMENVFMEGSDRTTNITACKSHWKNK